jgi:hypothetical protein
VAGDRYAVSGVIRTTGAAAALRPVRYIAEAEGRLRGGRYRPSRYAEDIDTGRRQSSTRIAWPGGIPVAETAGEARASGTPPDPASQKGAVDPLTALFAGLRDTARADACALRLSVFDGVRATRAMLADPQAVDGGMTCRGRYTRVAGFTDKEMAERQVFAFTARYADAGDGRLRLVELQTDTVFGPAVLVRRPARAAPASGAKQ